MTVLNFCHLFLFIWICSCSIKLFRYLSKWVQILQLMAGWDAVRILPFAFIFQFLIWIGGLGRAELNTARLPTYYVLTGETRKGTLKGQNHRGTTYYMTDY